MIKKHIVLKILKSLMYETDNNYFGIELQNVLDYLSSDKDTEGWKLF